MKLPILYVACNIRNEFDTFAAHWISNMESKNFIYMRDTLFKVGEHMTNIYWLFLVCKIARAYSKVLALFVK